MDDIEGKQKQRTQKRTEGKFKTLVDTVRFHLCCDALWMRRVSASNMCLYTESLH